jgi:hypothetical protein
LGKRSKNWVNGRTTHIFPVLRLLRRRTGYYTKTGQLTSTQDNIEHAEDFLQTALNELKPQTLGKKMPSEDFCPKVHSKKLIAMRLYFFGTFFAANFYEIPKIERKISEYNFQKIAFKKVAFPMISLYIQATKA